MTIEQTDESSPQKPLRLWPGVVLAILLLLIRFVVPIFAPEFVFFAMLGGLACALLIVVWWLFFSRAPWSERVGAIVLMIVALFAMRPLLHESIATAGQGYLFPIYAIPLLTLALVVWSVASRHLADGPRRATMVATILLASGSWTLLRTEGVSSGGSDFAWRWSKTSEERLLAQANDKPTALLPAPAAGGDRSRLARLSWTLSRQRHLWRQDRDRLVCRATRRGVASADRTGLVVLRGQRRLDLHAGTAW